MAAEFPPNLDDGELWLPSDIIPELGSQRLLSNAPDFEAIAKELAYLRMLDPYPSKKRPAPFFDSPPDLAMEVFSWPVADFGFGYFRCDGYGVPAGTGAYMPSVRQLGASKLGPAQVADGFGRRVAAAAQFSPFQVNGSGRSGAGTGVFLPRVFNYEASEIKRRQPASTRVGERVKQQAAVTNSPRKKNGNPSKINDSVSVSSTSIGAHSPSRMDILSSINFG